MTDRTYLDAIEDNPNATPEQRTALALTGLLSIVVDTTRREEREEDLIRAHDEADAALGRVLALADTFAANPRATLKPTAFEWVADQIRKAVDGPPPTEDDA